MLRSNEIEIKILLPFSSTRIFITTLTKITDKHPQLKLAKIIPQTVYIVSLTNPFDNNFIHPFERLVKLFKCFVDHLSNVRYSCIFPI